MILGRYRQRPGERRKRGLDYDDFLETSEIVTAVEFTVTPETDVPFEVQSYVIDPEGKQFAYWTQGGEDGQTYQLLCRVTTNGNQIREDIVEFDVAEDE